MQPRRPDQRAFPFATAREIEIGMGLARAHRISYVGELGWELYVSTDQAAHVFETLTEAGANHDLKLCGLHALDSCRIEKAFRHFGHDITDEDHVLEAGLGFAVRTQKPDFIGRDAVLRKREEGLSRRMVQFQLTDPEPMLFHNEAWCATGKIVSIVTSGNYGHALGGAIGMGYVPCPGETAEDVLGSTYEIEVAGSAPRGEGQPRAALRSEIGKGADVTTDVERRKAAVAAVVRRASPCAPHRWPRTSARCVPA
jgi:glycine cleavage system aminomethyltransferase T